MVARMLCRSLSWMGCVGLAAAAAAAAAAREGTAGVEGVVAVGEVGKGVMGVVGTWEEPRRLAAEVEVGVTAVDGLRGERTGSVLLSHSIRVRSEILHRSGGIHSCCTKLIQRSTSC